MKEPIIVIHIKGGVVEVAQKPLGCIVSLVDFDHLISGEPSVEVWTASDMTTKEDES